MESLESIFKKFVYTGVGFLSLSADKIKKTVDELVEKNKITEEEGKKILDDFFKEADTKKVEYEGKIKETINKISQNLKFAKAEDIENLSKRLEELEKAMEENKAHKE